MHTPSTNPDKVMARLVPFGGGFAPILALALSLLEIVPLRVGGPILVGLAMVTAAIVMALEPASRHLYRRGLGAGLMAVLIYDATRLPFVIAGDWPDFIPRIGDWLLDTDDVHWTIGYLWRYLGNGAGMGLAFAAALSLVGARIGAIRSGLVYGLMIWSGLITTLLVAPDGQAKMFQLTAATIALSAIGHVVYGTTLGVICDGHWKAAARTAADNAAVRATR